MQISIRRLLTGILLAWLALWTWINVSQHREMHQQYLRALHAQTALEKERGELVERLEITQGALKHFNYPSESLRPPEDDLPPQSAWEFGK